jgi:hypothetical protein
MAAQGQEAVSVIADERLRDGYAYWCRKAAGGKLPCRHDIDPAEIPHLLPHVRLVDVVAPGRFRYRLVGSETREHHLTNPTGRYVDEMLSPPAGPRVVALYDECVRDRRPLYVEHEFVQPNGLRRLSRVLFTPLSENGTTISQVLVFHAIAAPKGSADLDLWAQPYREPVHAPL